MLKLLLIPIGLSAITLLGWLSHQFGLASLGSTFIPMAPSTATLLPLLGLGLYSLHHFPEHRFSKLYVGCATLFTGALAVWVLGTFFDVTRYDIEQFFLRNTGQFGQVSTGRMSPVAAVNFLLLSVTISLVRRPWRGRIGILPALGLFSIVTVLIGYIYGTPILYGGSIIPMALPTAMSFFCLYLVTIWELGPEVFPLVHFSGNSARARLLRAFLPASFFAIVLHGLAFKFIMATFTLNFAVLSALSALVFTAVVSVFTGRIAHVIGSDIDKAEKAAQRLSKLKSDFLNNISHELRTPLNAVIGMSSLLLMEKLSEDQEESVRAIQRSGNNLLQLVDDILWFSEMHSKDRAPVENCRFSLLDLFEELKTEFKEQASRKNIEIQTWVSSSITPELEGDRKKIFQVLTRLVQNSLKFTEQGHVLIATRLKKQHPDQVQLIFEVIDTGAGIPEAVQKDVFGIFFQADSSSTRTVGGLGMGLAICKTLIESIGGKIGCESAEGKGTRVWFSLALKTYMKGATMSAEVDKKRILVVEDEPLNQRVISRLLEKMGYQVDLAGDGQEAVDNVVAGQCYSLILMDCQMPRMDGLEATTRLRALESKTGNRIPIIALTAHVSSEERARCFQAGMDDFISKPAPVDQLRSVLSHCLDGVAI